VKIAVLVKQGKIPNSIRSSARNRRQREHEK